MDLRKMLPNLSPLNIMDDPYVLRETRIREFTLPTAHRWVARALGLFGSQEYALGFDISKYQIGVDWSKAKKSTKYVFVRAAFGTTEDTKFKVHWLNSKIAGMKRGAYLYYLDEVDPKFQAQKFYELVKSTGNLGELPPVLDVETTANAQLTGWKIKLCLEEMEKLFGVIPMVYTGYYVWNGVDGDTSWAKKYWLWLAAYPFVGWKDTYYEEVKKYSPLVPAPWTQWDVWQWTNSSPASYLGVTGTVLDLDYCTEAFKQWFLGDDPPQEDAVKKCKCVVFGSYINVRSRPYSSAPDGGNFNANTIGDYFPEQTVVIKAELPNKEIWRLVRLADSTVGWAAEWHPSIKNNFGNQYQAIVDV